MPFARGAGGYYTKAMDRRENLEFIGRIEGLARPEDIIPISFLGDFNKILPVGAQASLMKKGSRKAPYMGFIVDPYCFFLAYEIGDLDQARSRLPEGYELAKTRVFEGDEERYLAIIGVFSARTSAFMGVRSEVYVIARNKANGRMSWIIAEYETNTNSYDPAHGFSGYTTRKAAFSTTPRGELLIDLESAVRETRISLVADLKRGRSRALSAPLWIEGNLQIDYGVGLRMGSTRPFSLIFDPESMREALDVPVDAVEVRAFSCCPSFIKGDKPVAFACFPYGQHYFIDNRHDARLAASEEDAERAAEAFIGTTDFKRMAGEDIKKPILVSMVLGAILNWGLIAFLVVMLILRR